MERIAITEDRKEQIAIGKHIWEDYSDYYDERMKNLVRPEVDNYLPDATTEEKEKYLYMSIYDYWVYGASIKEFFFYRFYEMNHEQKKSYLTQRSRLPYTYHLNSKEDFDLIEKKYSAYVLLKEFYLRDVICISSKSDYDKFCNFVSKHKEYVVKPSGLGLGIGIHKEVLSDDCDTKTVFDRLLSDGNDLRNKYKHWTYANVNADMVLEEVIEEDESIAQIHPYSVNPFRITTVLIDDTVHFFYPRVKFGNNKCFTTNTFSGAITCGVNCETGIIETDGYTEMCQVYERHPITNVKFKGFVVPKWNELKEMLTKAAKKVPTIRYVGWDVVLSKKGWCIIEGNFLGEFTGGQIAYHKGLKYEFEELIKWKMEKDFWWEYKL